MRRRAGARALALTVLAIGAGGVAAAADFNPAGLYAGIGIGQSNVRNDGYYSGGNYDFSRHDTAWQLTAGLRPISPLGVEYDYIRFGSSNGYYGNGDGTSANALFAVGYLPIPLPLVDVYGKLGVARLQTRTTQCCSLSPQNVSATSSDFAYGLGAQVKLSHIVLRIEYERVRDRGGDPDLLAAGLIWSF